MIINLWEHLSFTPSEFTALCAIAFAAGIVRGFTGFALSAFALAIAVLIIPPVQLIPVMWWLEISASVLMVRGGFREADNRVAIILVLGAIVGLFFGLTFTTSVNPDVSSRVALVALILLAAIQLKNIKIAFLGTTAGTVTTGIVSGAATGLAGIGGMVVALFVLSRNAEPRQMRATLVMYLFLGSVTSFGLHLWFGTMNSQATLRGLSLALPCMIGVVLGQRLFIPRFQQYYRPVCLGLLIGLGAISLLRTMI